MSERLCPVTEQPCIILATADEVPGKIKTIDYEDGTKLVVNNSLNAGEAVELAVQFPEYCREYQTPEQCGALYGRFLALRKSL